MKYETIILIDDDHIIRYGFKRLIKEFFASQDILTFKHGGDALEYFKSIDFNQFEKKVLILLDLNMPLINGWSFLEKFKEKMLTYGDIFTIYILSSTIDRNDIDNINRNTLISGHISKPLTLEELKELID